VAAKHLQTALRQALKKEDAAFEPVVSLPPDAPDWLKAKWPEGGPYHRFAPSDDLNRRVKHVADWIAGSVADGDPWLADSDAQSRPRKLLKLGSLEQAEAEADKAMQRKNQRLAARLVPDGEGEQTVMAMPDGYRIVQMTSATALDRESAFMGHCVGQALTTKPLRTARASSSPCATPTTSPTPPSKSSLPKTRCCNARARKTSRRWRATCRRCRRS
jgi:hypothetical protein